MKSFGYAVVAVAAMSLVAAGCDKKPSNATDGEKAPSAKKVAPEGDKKAASPGDKPAPGAAAKPAPGAAAKPAPGAAAKPAPGAAAKPAGTSPGAAPTAPAAAVAAAPTGAAPTAPVAAVAGAPNVAAGVAGAPTSVKTAPAGVEESYKGTVARAIVAAMNPDEPAGWELFKKELHTKELFAQRLKSYRRFNWPYMRRKVKLYLADDTKPEFKITRVEKMDDRTVKVFVHNEKSMPTPCILQKDEKQGGEYRITNCSL